MYLWDRYRLLLRAGKARRKRKKCTQNSLRELGENEIKIDQKGKQKYPTLERKLAYKFRIQLLPFSKGRD
ncbi:hypothetical protein POREN0001_0043 [Porphyromonas endodontalis ATCC 35406]|uniref:Uncharacterized protein n=1 Tax=Porphyromonas endodontalis (strain ATCC 35406 / DSM 24491 / JCM 8526 / CCUG 16442 / BCRC 14492 / NCTC 13058 / HG 370) TaxID=553175 RepID=C3JD54_POREA|nr:hypothetical protein POREN0001_0043 [Porphyromonas endodontalis ATCC 35406]